MKITVTQKLEAEISNSEAKHITVECIREAVGWKSGHIVRDGKLYLCEMQYSSHAWSHEILVGDATPNDLAAQRIINLILQQKSA
jgi:hypothetical protein